MSTHRIYLTEPSRNELSTVITALGDDAGRHWVELAESILHVRGGGQPSDGGTLNCSAVADVRCVDDVVRHYLAEPVGAVGDKVTVVLDRDRRDLMSRWHSSGHLVASVIEHALGVEFNRANQHPGDGWVSAESTITLAPDFLKEVNAAIVDAVRRSLPITVTAGELRKITIDGYRAVGCGGTHVDSTTDLHGLVVTRISAKKGVLRASFNLL